jgi:hypothetical protein
VSKRIRKSGDEMQLYVGVDMHKATFSAAVIDEDGSIVREAKLPSDPEQLRNFSYSLPSGSDGELFNLVLGIQDIIRETQGCSFKSSQD